jgi:hypothetical protein
MSRDFEGEIYGMKVKVSPYVEEGTVYLFNPKEMKIVAKMENFKPYGRWYSVKYYFRTLWKALKGRL